MTFLYHTVCWRWLIRAVVVTWLLIISAKAGIAQTRAGIPSAEQQKEIAKQLEGIHNLSRKKTAPEKQDVVKKLMATSRDKTSSPTERYVVLTTVIPLAKDVGEFASWLEAVNALVGAFEVDANKEKSRLLVEYLEASKSGAALKPAAVDESLALARAAAHENRYADASTLLSATEAAVRRPPQANALVKVVAEARESIAAREKDWKAFQTASTKLGTNGDDPAANFTVGRWHLLHQADWKSALPFLVKVSDAKWKAAAELEQAAPLDATAQFAVGDAWWNIAQGLSEKREGEAPKREGEAPAEPRTAAGAMKTALLLHAGEWYARAQPNLTSVLQKELVAKRLNEIASLKGAAPVKPAGPVNPNPNPSVTQTAQPPKPGEWIDLLEWSEGVDWAPRGIDWNAKLSEPPTRQGLKLKYASGASSYPLPAIVDGDYELIAEFTRSTGQELGMTLPVGIHNLALVFHDKVDGLGTIDGVWFSENPASRRPGRVQTGKKHRVRATVKRSVDQAEIEVDLDETQKYITWKGKESSLTNLIGGVWATTCHPCVHLVDTQAEFHSIRIRMLSGTISRDVITDSDREQDLKNGFVRLVGEKVNVPKVGWGQFLVNQVPLKVAPGDTERLWPLITRDFKACDDFYGAHAPSRLKCPIPTGAKSFSAIGYNDSSRTAKYVIYVDGKPVFDSGVTHIAIVNVDIPAKASLLELVIDPAGDPTYDHAYWCYPRFHSVVFDKVSDKMLDGKPGPLKFTIASNSVGAQTLTHNQAINTLKAIPLHFRDAQPCDEFLFAHAPSTVTYRVPEGMTRFTAIGYNVRNHHVKYEVWADAKQLPFNGQGVSSPSTSSSLPAPRRSS